MLRLTILKGARGIFEAQRRGLEIEFVKIRRRLADESMEQEKISRDVQDWILIQFVVVRVVMMKM